MSRSFRLYVLFAALTFATGAAGAPPAPWTIDLPAPGQIAAFDPAPPTSAPSADGLARGWPVDLGLNGAGYPYTPTLCDIDGDGTDEIFLTGGHTFGLRGDGSFLTGWPVVEQTYMGYGTNGNMPGPSVADVNRDGRMEVMWSERDWYAGSSRMWCFNGKNLDFTNMPGFPQEAIGAQSNALASPFVLGDLDNDGDLEAWSAHTLGNTGDYYRISAFSHSGARLFTIDLDPAEDILAPYYGDLEGDGAREMFAVTLLGADFRLHAWDAHGLAKPGYPVILASVSSGWLGDGVPIPVDLDNDGDLEILFGYWDGSASRAQCRHHTGAAVPGFPMVIAASSQLFYLGLGDLTGDGRPELLATDNNLGSGPDYRVLAFDIAAGVPLAGWPFGLPAWPKGFPAVADVDGDGAQDVLVETDGGALYAIAASGSLLAGYPKMMHTAAISGVAVGDIDGDDLLELVAATWDGWVYAWDTPGPAAPRIADWPMRGLNSRNTGVYGDTYAPAGIGETAGAWNGGPRILGIGPNPGVDRTTIRFLLPAAGPHALEMYDASGRRVSVLESGWRAAGEHRLSWTRSSGGAGALGSGTYWLVLRTEDGISSERMTILR